MVTGSVFPSDSYIGKENLSDVNNVQTEGQDLELKNIPDIDLSSPTQVKYKGEFVGLNTAQCMDGERDTSSMHSGEAEE